MLPDYWALARKIEFLSVLLLMAIPVGIAVRMLFGWLGLPGGIQ